MELTVEFSVDVQMMIFLTTKGSAMPGDHKSAISAEDPSLDLIQPVPEDKLQSWLKEFYGKPVEIVHREVLRHRDLSYVERLEFKDALPQSLIFKQVLPPWDIEQDLHERILIPSISNSPQLFMSAHVGPVTAMFMEDLGKDTLLSQCGDKNKTQAFAQRLGKELAKMHRSYSYRTDELVPLGILRSLSPIDYVDFTQRLLDKLADWKLLAGKHREQIKHLAEAIAEALAGEPISLSHGDLYAENIIVRGEHIYIIDWSWFAMLGVPLVDIATITMEHHKNAQFQEHSRDLLEAYCFESGKSEEAVTANLPYARALSRLLFLEWLIERKSRGIEGTTVGPVDNLLALVVADLTERLSSLKGS